MKNLKCESSVVNIQEHLCKKKYFFDINNIG